MTYRELYLKARRDLTAAGVDSPGSDALALLELFFGLDRPGLALHGQESPPPDREASFLRAAAQRADRSPLQYILGEWNFLGLALQVGEGVLIPREDTAVLVEALADALKSRPALIGSALCAGTGAVENPASPVGLDLCAGTGAVENPASPVGLDLCAGTGAVGLGLCSLLPEARVTCLELSEQAFFYLEKNLAAYPQYHTRAVKGNVLLPETAGKFAPASLDFIASNPPYIRAEELPGLQAEVQKEPAMALNGGQDGLTFYRAIARLWLPLLKPGGVLAVEIGEGQGLEVSALFSAHGLEKVEVKQDWSGLDRCVIGAVPRC